MQSPVMQRLGTQRMRDSIALTAPMAEATPASREPRSDAAVRRALMRADYIPAHGALRIRHADAATYDDPAPGGLYTHPIWLRTYGVRDLIIVEGQQPGCGVPRLLFTREGGGLLHLGRLLRLEADLVSALAEALMRQVGVPFVVFEDVDVPGLLPPGPAHIAFHYQNNWRLPLDRQPLPVPKRLSANTKRTLRNLARDNPGVSLRFAAAPGRDLLDTITAFGRIRIEGQGKRYGIDAEEADRLAAVAAEIGHSSVLTMGERVLAADVICVAGRQAHFLTHGYDPGYPTSSLGKITLLNSIEACAALGLADFNLMWGDLPYKQQVGAERVPLRTIVVRRSRLAFLHRGHLAALAHFGRADLKRRLKPIVTRLRERAGSRKPAPG